ncbi:MAG: hypothetical protein R3281_05625 [Balneolaceae bacterium]|nr:hypothetical protein [Balneolaceae bacterium]
MSITEAGFKLTFTKPFDPIAAKNPNNYQFQRYYYKYHQAYGSDRYDVESVPVKEVVLSSDQKNGFTRSRITEKGLYL